MKHRLLAGTALLFAAASAYAQQPPPDPPPSSEPAVDEGDEFDDTDTIVVVGQRQRGSVIGAIRSGLPKPDYLRGDAVGQTGGRARHEIEAQAGHFNNGLGARLSANYRTGSNVDNATGESLRFSPLGTVDSGCSPMSGSAPA